MKINCSAIVCLTIALEWGGTQYAWNSSTIIGLFVGFGLMIIIFVGLQFYRGDKATLPPSIVKQRSVASAALFMFFMGASMFVMIYYSPHHQNFSAFNLTLLVPIYFQAIKGSSPSQSGLQLLPLMLSLVVFSFVTGGLVTVLGYYTPFIIIGSAMFVIGAGLVTTYKVDTPAWTAYGYTIVVGAGCGLAFQNAFMAVQAVLPPSTLAIGNAIIMFAQTLS